MPPNSFGRAATARIQILAPAKELDFLDTQSIVLPVPVTPLAAWNIMHARPLPGMKLAVRLRDAISACFGVKRIGGISRTPKAAVKTGDKLDFFLVEALSDEVLTLTVRDRHLDVMTCVSSNSGVLSVTSSVKTHNLFGRVYMIPVRPAHRLIVARTLKRLQQELERRALGG
ncbi:DUF2867 domain-containing protein [Leisingera methylohalidivorans]|uniref:DUF2867 domain-containing protein n=1 Tax=Leisingera methylohalidivorans DSM 14336 TaxID=999552 RepID=V9VU89_9RHOB|nr:DUF2867 domain-containing protein [Leisingera methylohalidivorans]AHD00442.1 hypothetical protein METH_06600 [Leisingera methylohalidivorans DSM 14336]